MSAETSSPNPRHPARVLDEWSTYDKPNCNINLLCYHRLSVISSETSDNGNPMFPQIEAVSLTARVVGALKNAFFSGLLKPGEVIVERQISRQMNVGTPVVREALITLKHEGFVRRVKNKGSFITAFDADEVRELYTLRIELEPLPLQWERPLVSKSDLDE